MKKISVIVPIYKVEAYLNRCIESLLTQSFKDFELILVDDGSPDLCPRMCDEWAKKDDRIKVVHKRNGGLSDARNVGLKMAEGQYIAFVDSDDWVSKFFLEQLFVIAEREDADIVECQKRVVFDSDAEQGLLEIAEPCIYDTQKGLALLIEDKEIHQHVWNKLYKKTVLDEIWFEIGKTNEDEFWTYQVFGRAKKIVTINQELYYYYQRPNSIIHSQYSLKRLDGIQAKVDRQKYIDTEHPELSDLAKVDLIRSCIYSGQMSLKFLSGQELKKAKDIIEKIAKVYLKKIKIGSLDILKTSEKMWFLLAGISFWGTCRLKNLLKKGF